MKNFTCMLLVFSVLFASCDTNTQKANEEIKEQKLSYLNKNDS